MPGFATSNVVGVIPITSFYQLDTVPGGDPAAQVTSPQGQIVMGQDPWWGGGEFIRCRAGGTIRQFGLVQIQPTFNPAAPAFGQYEYLVTEYPAVTANLGRMVGVAMRNTTVGQYVWVQIAGVTPASANASVAAGTTFGASTVGQIGANTAGRQILNAVCVAPSATAVVKRATAPNASTILVVDNTDGWFPGLALSGTGIAASTVVTQIDINSKTVTVNNATTAAVNGNVTGTYTNFNIVHINRPTSQGAIT